MSREVHVRFCESRGVGFPPATHLVVLVSGTRAHAEAAPGGGGGSARPDGFAAVGGEDRRWCHIDEGFDFLGATRGRMVRASSLIGGLRPMTAT